MDKIRDPYFFDYWPFSATLRTLWHLVSWCRSLLNCHRTIPNEVVMARLSDRPTIRMQIRGARICICTSWFRSHSRPVCGSIRRISGQPCKAHSSRTLFSAIRRSGPNFTTSSASKFDAFYGPLFRELMRIRTRRRHDSLRNPFGRSTTCSNGDTISMVLVTLIKIKCHFQKLYKFTIRHSVALVSFYPLRPRE